MNSKLLSRTIYVMFAVYVVVWLTLGSVSGGNKALVWTYFIVDVLICAASLTCGVLTFFASPKVSAARSVVFILISLLLCAFTWFAFLTPECGLPPYLFSV